MEDNILQNSNDSNSPHNYDDETSYLDTLMRTGIQEIKFDLSPNKKKRKSVARSKFTESEDKKLLELVNKYGENSWALVSSEMENRSTRQCRDRYKHYISPQINQSAWTAEEDKLLVEKVDSIGERWKILEVYFRNRTEVQLRNRYYAITHCKFLSNPQINSKYEDNNCEKCDQIQDIYQVPDFLDEFEDGGQENEYDIIFGDIYYDSLFEGANEI